ncbi:MAG: serine/threonine-protein phosphatase [Elusimicrobia bacterium]|nr:serine/threonine-protein phosphatase [Elusimicrobiota bacterium]
MGQTTPVFECAVHAVSDVGRRRSENQDAWFADAQAGLFLVADGMGGLAAGSVASQAAAEVLPKMLEDRLAGMERATETAFEGAIRKTIAEFSGALRERSRQDASLKGTGTTIVLALVRGKCAYVANLGDSRAYILRHDVFRQVTEDHSVAALMHRLGKITAEQARAHPARSTLTRHAGMEGEARADVRLVHLKGPCRLLLCSDGLTGMLSDDRIKAILASEPGAEAARRLVAEANEAGGHDNITALVVDLRRGA